MNGFELFSVVNKQLARLLHRNFVSAVDNQQQPLPEPGKFDRFIGRVRQLIEGGGELGKVVLHDLAQGVLVRRGVLEHGGGFAHQLGEVGNAKLHFHFAFEFATELARLIIGQDTLFEPVLKPLGVFSADFDVFLLKRRYDGSGERHQDIGVLQIVDIQLVPDIQLHRIQEVFFSQRGGKAQ